jgi:16S rRNA (uracil1498-N3)-methyltransferase
MADRYYCETPIAADRAQLAGAEAHHLIHVMRARPGVRVTLFDGSGAEFTATVAQVGRAEVELAIVERREANRELPFGLTLAVALPKGDRQQWLVEKAVELGVGEVVPLRTARSVAQPVAQALARLRRTVIEAAKQCGRNRLMPIGEPCDWEDYLDQTRAAACRLLAQPGGGGLPRAAADAALRAAPQVIAAIGPEGGFTADELRAARVAGWRAIDLGPRILRVETAALAVAATICAQRQPWPAATDPPPLKPY